MIAEVECSDRGDDLGASSTSAISGDPKVCPGANPLVPTGGTNSLDNTMTPELAVML